MEPQESSAHLKESRPERAGLLGSGFVRDRCHEIILAGYFENGGHRIFFPKADLRHDVPIGRLNSIL
jgi:hypothetical protein